MDENHKNKKHKRKISLSLRFIIFDKESIDCKEKKEKLDLIKIKHLQDEVSSSIFKVGKI